jgi:hypothetical protein
MLIPQYSLRWLFGLTVALAFCLLILRAALNDVSWALGVVAILLMLLCCALVAAVQFSFIYLLGGLPIFRAAETPPLVPGAEQESPIGMRNTPNSEMQ